MMVSDAPAARWWWRFLDADGEVSAGPQTPGFTDRDEAESWLGEHWADLLDEGVGAVELYADDELVMGPMDLSS